MVAILILKVVLLQLLSLIIVIFILKKILDNCLINLAIQKFESLHREDLEPSLSGVIVIVRKKLGNKERQRLSAAAYKKFNRPMDVLVRTDKSILGGAIIKGGRSPIDLSLITRLKEGGFFK